jgi:hypothetical protein
MLKAFSRLSCLVSIFLSGKEKNLVRYFQNFAPLVRKKTPRVSAENSQSFHPKLPEFLLKTPRVFPENSGSFFSNITRVFFVIRHIV